MVYHIDKVYQIENGISFWNSFVHNERREGGRRRTVLIAVYQQQKNTNKNTIGSASAKRNKPRI